MAREFTRNGDYTLKKLELSNFEGRTLPLSDAFVRLSYFESIYENCSSGSILINDSYDLSQYFPLIGEETLTLGYTTDGTDVVEKSFYVYRAETQQQENTLTHVLYFVSKEALTDQNSLVSKSYNKKTSDVIVQDLYEFIGTDKILTVEPTKGLHHIIVPSWTPFQAINWLGSFTQHPSYVSGCYLFYEDKNGYNFTPIEKLIDSEPIDSYVQFMQNLTKSEGGNNRGKSIVEVRQLSGTVDTLKSLSDGLYANEVIAYDNISKSYQKFDYSYSRDFDKTIHLNEFRLNSDMFEFTNKAQRKSVVPSTALRGNSEYFKSKIGDPLSHKIEETSYFKTSVLSQINARQFEITFNGDSLLTCGKVVNVDTPNISQLDTKKSQPHKFNRKKFLLVSCTHTFTKTKYMVVARAASDSLINTPSYDL